MKFNGYFRFSRTQIIPHIGFIYNSPIVQETPPVSWLSHFDRWFGYFDENSKKKISKKIVLNAVKFVEQDLRRKAARLVAAKCTLAARVDASHESVNGETGLQFKEEIEKKLDKLQEPPPVKFIKPLPKPIEISKKKRGGKRVRKMKERYAMTEFRKQANRLNFGDVSLVPLTIPNEAVKPLNPLKCVLFIADLIFDDFSHFFSFQQKINRLMKMHIKTIWDIHVERSERRAPVESVCHKSTKKPKCASAKRYRKIYKSNKFTAVIPQFASRFQAQLQVSHLRHCKVLKLLIHKQPKNQSTQMPSIFQTHPDLCPLESEPLKI